MQRIDKPHADDEAQAAVEGVWRNGRVFGRPVRVLATDTEVVDYTTQPPKAINAKRSSPFWRRRKSR